MIKYLYANNYKSFVNFRMDFDTNNLLLGGNGTGKSNLIVLLAGLCSFIRDNRNNTDTVFLSNSRTRWMNSNIQTFELGIENEGKNFVYHLEIEHNKDNTQSGILTEKLQCEQKALVEIEKGNASIFNDLTNQYDMMFANTTVSLLSYIVDEKRYKSVKEFLDCINKIVYCVPDPHRMSAVVENNVYYPTYNFTNIASLYTGLVEIFPEFQSDFTNAMKEINPSYVGAYSSLHSFPKTLAIHYKYKDAAVSFGLEEVSDGEKMLFALYMILYGFLKNSYTVLLDEPDNYLGLREIQPWCMELENILTEGGQCILVSHHPEVINYFTDSSGIWLDRLQSGESVVKENPFSVFQDEKVLLYSEMIARGMDVSK